MLSLSGTSEINPCIFLAFFPLFIFHHYLFYAYYLLYFFLSLFLSDRFLFFNDFSLAVSLVFRSFVLSLSLFILRLSLSGTSESNIRILHLFHFVFFITTFFLRIIFLLLLLPFLLSFFFSDLFFRFFCSSIISPSLSRMSFFFI